MDISGLTGAGGQQQNVPQIDNDDRMGRDEFTKILITQLQYQDPLDPMDDREFIVQLTQFSMLEQLHNLTDAKQQSSVMSLLGKQVAGTDEDGNWVEGTVSGIKNFNGTPALEVDGKLIEMKHVEEVKQANEIPEIPEDNKETDLDDKEDEITEEEMIEEIEEYFGGGSL